ncbi:MAG: DUF488 domain-containing protein [Candidatus Obscuribacterales bacterium]|jgi:uncharacterized protein (DUF488 family)|nr:DUF488 domain-containing protein [Candidatus Obscuribacterales bacterium]
MADLFTVGHSNYPIADFISLLGQFEIEVLVDVRSNPYARYATHFTGPFLKQSIVQAGLKYLYLGKELGGMPKEPEFYDDEGNLNYAKLAATSKFQEGMERLVRGVQTYQVAIMCAEEDPSHCHRHRLISKAAKEMGVVVKHIRKGARVQSDDELIAEYTPDTPEVTQLNLFGLN